MKVEYKNKWVAVLSDKYHGEEYFFIHENNKVVVLPYFYDEHGNLKIVYLMEPVKIWGRRKEFTAVTGTIEDGENPQEAAPRELFEETGYKVDFGEKWTSLGQYNISKGSDRRSFLFLVDVSGVERVKKTTDGSAFEKATNIVISKPQVATFSSDIHLHLLYAKLQQKIAEGGQESVPLPMSNRINFN